MTSATTTEYPSATIATTTILDHIDKLRNAGITDSSVSEITTSIRALINYCNAKFLKDFPIDAVYKLINTLQTEIKSWYFSNLSLTNIHECIINTFEDLERNSYHTQIEISNRCLDAF